MTTGWWDIFAIRGPYIPKYRVGGNSHIRDILYFFRKDAVDLLFVPGRDPPAATWPARTQHMAAQQHTQPTAARMKPPARHHEKRTTTIAGLAL